MKVVQARKQRGSQDEEGRVPGKTIPQGDALRAAGSASAESQLQSHMKISTNIGLTA
jgi:hypothetical protein